MFFTDSRVIHRHGAFEVLAQRHEVLWQDGTTVGLHPVRRSGHTDMFLRALHDEGLHWIVFDLRDLPLAPKLADDLRRHLERDHVGIVFYTLRLAYRTARQLLADVGTGRAAWCSHPQPEPAALAA